MKLSFAIKTEDKNNFIMRIIAFCITVCFILSTFSGCEKTVKPSSGGKKSNKNNTSSEDTVSLDPTRGEISFTESEIKDTTRDDADEILPTKVTANLYEPLTGFLEKEATTLRNSVLNTSNTENIYKISGKKYYISPGGDDDNDGLSPARPFRTIDGCLNNAEIESGDAVLFERNSVFRLTQPISAKKGVIYGSYGKGNKPKIYGSPINFAKQEWMPSNRKNIWMINYVYDDACSVIINNGEKIGVRKTGIRNMAKDGDFYQDLSNSLLYLYCSGGNPQKIFKSVDVATKMSIFYIPNFVENVTIDNLCLKYSGSHGINGAYGNNKITVTNCEIGYMGGMTLGSVRAGNAIQMWSTCRDFVVKHNWIYQSWDTAVTWQGTAETDRSYGDIEFSDNLLEYNNGDFEYWHANVKLGDFAIKNNICRFTSLGWGTRKDDGGYRGIEGVFVGNTENMSLYGKIVIKDNKIDCPGRQIINWKVKPADRAKFYNISGNSFYVNSSLRTTSEVIRDFKQSATDPESISVDSLSDFKKAISGFGILGSVVWN